MCLYIDNIKTEQELAKDVPVWTFYKLFLKRDNPEIKILRTPYRDFEVRSSGIKSIPNNEIIDQCGNISIWGGVFHARVDEKSIKQDMGWVDCFLPHLVPVCLPILVKKEDIVAFGIQDDVAVMSYEITQEVWDKID
jgi:hypothetical protein